MLEGELRPAIVIVWSENCSLVCILRADSARVSWKGCDWSLLTFSERWLDSVRRSLIRALAYFTYGVLFTVPYFFKTSSSCFVFILAIDIVDPVGGILENLVL